MARGFDSKFVEAQQEEATRPKVIGRALTPEQLITLDRRKALEMSRARAAADLERATVPAHKRMLEEALKSLDRELQNLGT
jgi:hypothetical protein